MNKYRITVEYKNSPGCFATYYEDANTEEEAIELFKQHNSMWLAEDAYISNVHKVYDAATNTHM